MCALLCTAVADPAEWQGYGGTQKHFSPSQAMASEPLRVHSSRLPQAWSLQQSPHQSPPGKWMRNTMSWGTQCTHSDNAAVCFFFFFFFSCFFSCFFFCFFFFFFSCGPSVGASELAQRHQWDCASRANVTITDIKLQNDAIVTLILLGPSRSHLL